MSSSLRGDEVGPLQSAVQPWFQRQCPVTVPVGRADFPTEVERLPLDLPPGRGELVPDVSLGSLHTVRSTAPAARLGSEKLDIAAYPKWVHERFEVREFRSPMLHRCFWLHTGRGWCGK
ncbi:hypothetical protein ACSHXN_42640 [Streptomyces sp. HUAS TT11]|uniref:hypothetical protein n=1 Tax=Streptomyces sp. HUAS TT11 TaxID=3447508 RepID=UPI003F65E1B4